MRHIFWLLLVMLLPQCDQEVKPPYEQLSDSTYVNLIIDLSIADVAVNRESNRNIDSLREVFLQTMNENYNLDSMQITQAINYLEKDLPRMKKIYERVSEELNQRIDSLSKAK